MPKPPISLVPSELVEKSILLLRGQKVMLDSDLAKLYNVPTKALNQAVKRNRSRFPEDFMFRLTSVESSAVEAHKSSMFSRSQSVTLRNESKNLKSQIVTSSWGGGRKGHYAFTEQGVAMLSSVLTSKRAVQVNIAIMRAFVRLRELIASNKALAVRLEEMEKKYDKQFAVVFEVIRQLTEKPRGPEKAIGFH